MASIRFPTVVLFGALLACGGPEIDRSWRVTSESTCNSDDDCPKGQTCSEGFFGGWSCSPPYQPPSYGGGGAGAGASAGSGGFAGFVPIGTGGVFCGGQPCEAPVIPGLNAKPCCVSGDQCGAVIVALSPQCIELDQPGDLEPSCPPQLLLGEQLPGCCKPNGWCGVLHSELGCANPAELGGVPAPSCVLGDPGGIDASADAGDEDAGVNGD